MVFTTRESISTYWERNFVLFHVHLIKDQYWKGWLSSNQKSSLLVVLMQEASFSTLFRFNPDVLHSSPITCRSSSFFLHQSSFSIPHLLLTPPLLKPHGSWFAECVDGPFKNLPQEIVDMLKVLHVDKHGDGQLKFEKFFNKVEKEVGDACACRFIGKLLPTLSGAPSAIGAAIRSATGLSKQRLLIDERPHQCYLLTVYKVADPHRFLIREPFIIYNSVFVVEKLMKLTTKSGS